MEPLVDPPPHARISRVLDGAKADIFLIPRRLAASMPGSSPDLHLHPTLQPRQNDDSMRTPTPTLPPLNPIALCVSQQVADGVCGALTGPLHLQSDSAWQCELSQGTKQAVNPRSDAFDGEPGSSPDLHLHPTLQPRQNDDSMRTPAPTLPPLNPIALCDSEQDADGVCGALTGPLLLQSDSASTCTPRFNLDRTTTQRGRRHRPFLRLTLSPCATLSRLWTMFVALLLARCSSRARMRGSA
jgi:hypothetical protein